ncbi:MAG TPA: transposase, partial [Rhabdochlamydiaceae bacterium]|nr:transposase [Rhabdochlamydiaceae bacterium]
MKRLQAFQFELHQDEEKERSMRKFTGACRFVFNKALAIQISNHEAGNKFISYESMAKQLTQWRNSEETPWLYDAPCHSLQHALKDLDLAFKNFFAKRTNFPCFKRKGQKTSFRYPDPAQIKLDQNNSRIFLPKLGWLRYRKSRKVVGEVRNVTVTNIGKKWFISIQTEREAQRPKHPANTSVGIDMGIARFATMSDGNYIAPLNSFKKKQERLRRSQRDMRRKVKFSNNWKKEKAKVQKIHTGIANARKDFLHKATTAISKNHALVCVEELQVRKMSKSASGTQEEPGTNVRRKTALNRSILDQGWAMFRTQLEYKLQWNGGMLVMISPEYTSQTCPPCKHVSEKSRKTQAQFECVNCKYKNHADVVGAMNILERGLRSLACGEMVHLGRSTKQEPAEA